MDKDFYVCGIDEAGKGCVIGPLVVCIAVVDKSLLDIVEKDDRIKDSKVLSKKSRIEIAKEYKNKIFYKIQKILPEEIDKNNINTLELKAIKNLLITTKNKFNKRHIKEIIIDSPFKNNDLICTELSKIVDTKISLEHKADRNYKIVSLASIIAKVTRDLEINKIKKKLKIDFGSGYPSDKKTILALKKYGIERFNGNVRKKWQTIKHLSQRRLDEF
ncbi:MAG: ribonuclease HII [Candidatus Micrarchaeota archaeon]|nr:ribonuclease HII [Candidatus Micrarchaeota archaeon]